MVSFSQGWLTAIIRVKATSALSGILFSPFTVKRSLFFQESIEIKMQQFFYYHLQMSDF
jgi:hypothetical protein